jgi:16S rRNA (cytidine1402-2'-O)-methyltransferase
MSADTAQRGGLVLIPNALDFGADAPPPIEQALPLPVIQRAAGLIHWLVENPKSARAFLKRVGTVTPLARPIQELDLRELPSAKSAASGDAIRALLAPALAGAQIGLLSEAGLPGVADPGAALVTAAHEAGLTVEALPGPSALLLALAASGLNGQAFAFVGYLPVKEVERAARIRELDAHSRRARQTQIAIETPYRNGALLAALIEHLQPATRLCVACALTWPQGWCRTRSVRDWRRANESASIDNRLPAVFLWQAA